MNEFIKNQNITIAEYDSDLSKHLEAESNRQEEHIELIASENYASKRILEAQGSVLTNKYAEGYPNKRYYGGCEHVDGAETLAIERAKTLFNAKICNRNIIFKSILFMQKLSFFPPLHSSFHSTSNMSCYPNNISIDQA